MVERKSEERRTKNEKSEERTYLVMTPVNWSEVRSMVWRRSPEAWMGTPLIDPGPIITLGAPAAMAASKGGMK
jgi:hypothetical protein